MPRSQRRGTPVVYLHVGPMKTGTTYLQNLMYANRSQLAEAGVRLPGRYWVRQVRGVQEVLALSRRDAFIRREASGAWDDLLAEVANAPGEVSVISMEFLSFATPRLARRVVRSLAWADVRVVFTVRDMTSVLPSQWQTMVHNAGAFSWPDYLEAVPEPGVPRVTWPHALPSLPGRPRINFHRNQNVPRMLLTWGDVVGDGALHVVTVPKEAGQSDVLWQRLASVIGVDPAVATESPARTNPSLGYASTDLVRRINERVGRLTQSEYNWTMKEHVALKALAPLSAREPRATLSRAAYDRGLAWNQLTRDTMAAAGAVLTGSADDLPVTTDRARRDALPEVPPLPDSADVLEAALVAARALRRLTRSRTRRLRRLGVRPDAQRYPRPVRLRDAWMESDDPVAAAAEDLAAQARQAALLLRRIRKERHSRTP